MSIKLLLTEELECESDAPGCVEVIGAEPDDVVGEEVDVDEAPDELAEVAVFVVVEVDILKDDDDGNNCCVVEGADPNPVGETTFLHNLNASEPLKAGTIKSVGFATILLQLFLISVPFCTSPAIQACEQSAVLAKSEFWQSDMGDL